MIKTFLSRLLPQDKKFYAYLEKLSSLAQHSAAQLKIYVESTDAAAQAEAARALSRCKTEAKAVSAHVTRELCLTFVTPFDREDIQGFAFSLYKIIKVIDKVRQRLNMHTLTHDQGDFSRQIELILLEAQAMQDMVAELIKGGHNSKHVLAKVSVLQEIENRGDILLGELMTALFKNERPVRDLILRKDIYDLLEKAIDGYRDAAGIALQIVLKNS